MGPLYCIQQLLCHFEFLVLVLGHHCPLCDPKLYYYQMTEEECNTCPGYVALLELLKPNKSLFIFYGAGGFDG